MGHLDQTGPPKSALTIRLLQQVFKVVADEQLIAARHGLVGEKPLEAIQQFVRIQAERTHQVAITTIAEQHLEEVLHIQLAMAPAACQILTRQQQLPGVVTKAIRLRRQACGRFNTGAGRRGHGGLNLGYAASERDESWINSTL